MRNRSIPLGRLPASKSFDRGLSTSEAAERRALYGGNDIVEIPGNPWLELARDTAKDPMLWFFAGTGVVYAFVGERVEAVTLFAAILPLLFMDVFLHQRTAASTEGLKNRLAAEAVVIRDGTGVRIPSADIVPGDLVMISPGDMLPADGVFIEGDGLQVEESALTGEAYPVLKHPIRFASAYRRDPLVEEQHWGFAGTRLLTGSAAMQVIFTGAETHYGEIIQSTINAKHEITPLQLAIRNLVKVLLVAAALLCFGLAAARLSQGFGWLDALLSAVTLATAAIPEEFPIAFTFFLGVGVYRLAKRHALVRRAVTVENIGRVTSICSDKTGTITEGRLRLAHVRTALGVDQTGAMALARMASREESGDPMDQAVLEAAYSGADSESFKLLTTFPFTEDRKRETAIASNARGEVIAACKGAAEVVLRMCAIEETEREAWEREAGAFAEGGHKVIALASRICGPADVSREPSEGYQFAGLLAFEDTIRDGVREAIEKCRVAGIHTIMVTGDHALTARAVALEIGLGGESPRVVSGDDVQELIRTNDTEALGRIDVVARATPAQKLLLVRSLKSAGEIVAVTGDGVNDVPALQLADIGVAMGQRGTRSAREVASIVLMDDNFHTLAAAIAEGQQLFRNLQLCFQYLLIIHIPLVLTAAAIPLAGYPLVYLPIHIVWLEMVIHPTALLVFQEIPEVTSLFHQHNNRRTASFYNRREWVTIAAVGILLFAFVSGGYVRSLKSGHNVEHARATAMAILTFASAGCTAALSRLRTRIAAVVVGGTLMLSVALIQIPPISGFLHFQPLHWDDWLFVILGTAVPAGLLLVRSGTHRHWTGITRRG